MRVKQKLRLIPNLDIKGDYLIKGVNLEGLRKIGNLNHLLKNIIVKELTNY